MPAPDRSHALDHVVVVLFENRSLDNVLGHLYGPEDGKNFDGVIGKDLSNPIPEWAEHGAERKVVPYTVATDMDSPNPDSGEEYFHTNTQLYNTLDDHNRFKIGEAVTAPWNAPPPGATPTMDGFVTDYISTFTGEIGRQPTYDEYAHIMTGYTPEQLPVLNGIARDFGVFDHWFCEVPSQTFMNRSFWTAATSSGLVVNSPMKKWFTENDAETIFERLEAHGKTWKVYVMEPMPLSFTGMIHYPPAEGPAGHPLRAVRRVREGRRGGHPAGLLAHRAEHARRATATTTPRSADRSPTSVDIAMDSPSSMLAGRGLPGAGVHRLPLRHLRDRARTSGTPPLLIGWDEPGGTYDHVPPGPVPPPDPAAPAGEFGFTFDRSGYRVPAIIVSPWVEPGSVYNEEYRHTSLIATLRKTWGLGEAFTQRDASARTFDHVFSLDTPRDPETWATVTARPVPEWTMDLEVVGTGPEHPGQGGMAPALIAQGERDGRDAARRARRPRSGTRTGQHRPAPAGCRRSLLPAAGRRCESPRLSRRRKSRTSGWRHAGTACSQPRRGICTGLPRCHSRRRSNSSGDIPERWRSPAADRGARSVR